MEKQYFLINYNKQKSKKVSDAYGRVRKIHNIIILTLGFPSAVHIVLTLSLMLLPDPNGGEPGRS